MNIKVFIIKALVFVVLLIGADQLCGFGFRKLYTISGDKFAREEYIRHDMEEDLLIFGSSRAAQHYVASMIGDSLGVTAYNCGHPGNGVIYEYGRLKTILNRYTPKYIIIDVSGTVDLEPNDNMRYLDFLKLDYGHNDSVDALFREIDPLCPLKMQLQSYRYNSTICDLLLNIVLRDRNRYREDGFFPLQGHMKLATTTASKKDVKVITEQPAPKFDPIKQKYLHKLVEEMPEECQLIFSISPVYGKLKPYHLEEFQRIADEYGIQLLNYSENELFQRRPDLFRNTIHMNEEGAILFSSMLASDLKQMLQK